MNLSSEVVLLGARIPSSLKEQLSLYCATHGVKMNHFVSRAIKDKLDEMMAEQVDKKIVRNRLKTPQFSPQKKMDQYLMRRKSRRAL